MLPWFDWVINFWRHYRVCWQTTLWISFGTLLSTFGCVVVLVVNHNWPQCYSLYNYYHQRLGITKWNLTIVMTRRDQSASAFWIVRQSMTYSMSTRVTVNSTACMTVGEECTTTMKEISVMFLSSLCLMAIAFWLVRMMILPKFSERFNMENCPPTWDSLACWPYTAHNSRVYQDCPDMGKSLFLQGRHPSDLTSGSRYSVYHLIEVTSMVSYTVQ